MRRHLGHRSRCDGGLLPGLRGDPALPDQDLHSSVGPQRQSVQRRGRLRRAGGGCGERRAGGALLCGRDRCSGRQPGRGQPGGRGARRVRRADRRELYLRRRSRPCGQLPELRRQLNLLSASPRSQRYGVGARPAGHRAGSDAGELDGWNFGCGHRQEHRPPRRGRGHPLHRREQDGERAFHGGRRAHHRDSHHGPRSGLRLGATNSV